MPARDSRIHKQKLLRAIRTMLRLTKLRWGYADGYKYKEMNLFVNKTS